MLRTNGARCRFFERNKKVVVPNRFDDLVFHGAPGGIRTHNHRIRSPVLYPLSHGGEKVPMHERASGMSMHYNGNTSLGAEMLSGFLEGRQEQDNGLFVGEGCRRIRRRQNLRPRDAGRQSRRGKGARGFKGENTLHSGRWKRWETRRERTRGRKNQKFEIRYCICLATCL